MGKKHFACTAAMVTSSSHFTQQWGQKAVGRIGLSQLEKLDVVLLCLK